MRWDYAQDHPDRLKPSAISNRCSSKPTDRFLFQPCVSPIWGHRHLRLAMGEAGLKDDPRLTRAADWRSAKRSAEGDWSVKRPERNPPDGLSSSPTSFTPISTTRPWCCWRSCMPRDPIPMPRGLRTARRELVCWPCNRRTAGGPPSMSITNWAVLNQVPFADHNAMPRSHLPGYHRACAGVPLPARPGRHDSRPPRRGLSSGRAGEGRQLVRPLGRELHLRYVLAMRVCMPAARRGPPTPSTARPRGCAPFRIPTAGGANRAPATTGIAFAPAPSSARRRRGRCSACGRRRHQSPQFRQGVEYLLRLQTADASGPRPLPPVPASPTSSTSATPCTAITFPCWRFLTCSAPA